MSELKIEVFTSPTCPHCPGAVRATKKLLEDHPELTDCVKWREMNTGTPEGRRNAQKYEIRTVPTIILTNSSNEKGGINGTPTQEKYLNIVYEMLGKEMPKAEKPGETTRKKSFIQQLFKK
ncbi:MAG TPA: hypothetical protein ENN13_03180 [Candidatus Altiarchaeales archaeon]|nr:hypothetical protein [Candidatus Altiarchaeales archaeon]